MFSPGTAGEKYDWGKNTFLDAYRLTRSHTFLFVSRMAQVFINQSIVKKLISL